MEIIRMKNVSVTVQEKLKDKSIFSELTLSVDKGEKVLVKGRSGIGKTTIFRLILGFTKPSAGEIYFEGKRINPALSWDIRKRVAHISQNSDIGEGPVMSLFDEVFSYDSNQGKFDLSELEDLLSEFSLQEDILSKKFENLSGGEKQRIAIIISLLTKKDIFLLDEITSGLDIALKEKIVNFFLSHPEWTVIAISHDPEWEREGIRVIEFSRVIRRGE